MNNVLLFPDPVEKIEAPKPNAEVYVCKCLSLTWYLKSCGAIVCTVCGSTSTNLRTVTPL